LITQKSGLDNIQVTLSKTEQQLSSRMTQTDRNSWQKKLECASHSSMYKTACVLDPMFAFQWLEHDHPGDAQVKQCTWNAIHH